VKRYKKKKGSSFIVVIAVTSIIFVLATAMLGMVVSGFKSRIAESKRLQNMYESDSRLDVVYNIIRKTSGAAIIKASKENDVKDESDKTIQNTNFKTHFINYLRDGLDATNTNNLNLKQCIKQLKYPEYGAGGIVTYVDLNNSYSNAEITVVDPFTPDEVKKKIDITVQSTFETKGEKNKNMKTIEAKFIVQAPDYKDIDVINGTDIELSPVYNGKIITADGDMTAEGDITTSGDIWVKGTDDGNNFTNYFLDKYKGGVMLNGGKLLSASGNIFTSKTVNINESKVGVGSGNIYSSNTYLSGNKNNSDKTDSKDLLEINGDLITNNDLTFDSPGSSATMTNYYGINDKNIDERDNPDLEARESSCIIVNNTNATLTINNDAYIMGVAYIDTKEKYQTGESVAIKGNYVAYTDPGTNEKLILKYYNPLQLIEFTDQNSTVQDKATHFVNFFKKENESRKNDIEKANGINLKTVYSAGAYVDKDGVHENNIYNKMSEIEGDENKIGKKGEFATNVLAMGSTFGFDGTEDSDFVKKVYNDEKAIRTVGRHDGESNHENIASNAKYQVDFDEIDEAKKEAGEMKEGFGKVVLNEHNETVTISAGKIIVGNTTIDLSKQKDDMIAFIVTNGDVVVDSSDGDVNFTGNIITSGNVTIKGSNKINLIYDQEVTKNIYAVNKECFNKIFINRLTDQKVHANPQGNEPGDLSDYNDADYLKKGTWKLIK
jgi:hypothetical protein